MQKVRLRRAKLKDCSVIYDMICELENEILNHADFEKVYITNLDDKNIYYVVAEIGGCVVGFISIHIQELLHHNGRAAEIQELFVKDDLRNGGIGKSLSTIFFPEPF